MADKVWPKGSCHWEDRDELVDCMRDAGQRLADVTLAPYFNLQQTSLKKTFELLKKLRLLPMQLRPVNSKHNQFKAQLL